MSVNQGDPQFEDRANQEFVRFPRTPELSWPLDSFATRGARDQDASAILGHTVSVEEKVDGANLGLSVGPNGRLRAQSRGRYLRWGTGGQWAPLWRWLTRREDRLISALGSKLVLFGEWCYAEHSLAYDALPDWMLAFDVYERFEDRFWSRTRRNTLVQSLGLVSVPLLGEGVYNASALPCLIGQSRCGRIRAEGIYLRWDDGPWLAGRAKLVRPDWVMASDDHWMARPLKNNRLARSQELIDEGP